MLILSQDKETILNFNNAVTLYVIRDSFSEEKGLENYNIDYSTNDEINYVLGTYATRERAKEVLQEIFKVYRLNKMFECSDRIEQAQTLQAILKENMQPFTYEMPEK